MPILRFTFDILFINFHIPFIKLKLKWSNKRMFMERFIPTDKSLELSQSLAESMGMPFDKEDVRELSKNLHPLYFNEILKKLQLSTEKFEYTQGSIRKLKASVAPNDKKAGNVFFDEMFDFWLMNICFLNAIATFKVLKEKQFNDLESLFVSTLDSTSNGYLHESIREVFEPLLFDHQECLRFAHHLSKSMIAFILCHEIAHVDLGHLGKKERPEYEIEADAKAFQYYKELLNHPDKSGYLSMGTEFLTAPILLFNYFSIAEKYKYVKTGEKTSRETHPNPIDRAKELDFLYKKVENEKASYYLEGFFKGLFDLVEPLNLPKKL